MHVHSTYSDGQFTLRELLEVFRAEGCAFVAISDHAEYFDERMLAQYHEELESLSNGEFFFVHGLEFSCEQGMHILGYGARELVKTQEPQDVIARIQQQAAIAVIAHPKNEHLPWIENFDVLPDGIEVWNTKYDGKHAPCPATFALMQRLRARRPAMGAFYGQDLHWRQQSRVLFVEVESAARDAQAVLTALRAGAYIGRHGEMQLPSSGALAAELLARFGEVQQASSRRWQWVKAVKKAMDRAGIPVPEALKAPLRRFF